MAMFAVINPDRTVLRFEQNLDPNAGTKAGYKILPVFDTRPPEGKDQITTGPVITVGDTEVTRVWTVSPMKDQEIMDRDEDMRVRAMVQIDSQFDITKALSSMLFDVVNDVRVLKGQGTITAEQFRAAIKAKL